MSDPSQETVAQQLRRLARIVEQVSKVGTAEQDWLMRRLAEKECAETAVGRAWNAIGPNA